MTTSIQNKIIEAIHTYPYKHELYDNSSMQFISWMESKTGLDLTQLTNEMFPLLHNLASNDYKHYLQSTHWRQLSRRKKQESNYTCEICHHKGEIHVHHKTYERLGRELLSDLMSLCKYCHKIIHKKVR